MDFKYKQNLLGKPMELESSTQMGTHATGKVKVVKPSKAFHREDVVRIISINFPIEVAGDSRKYKKKYSVEIRYEDKEGHRRTKTLFFGQRGDSDYVDHKNSDFKRVEMARLRKCADVFDKNFYRLHLLNGPHTDIAANYSHLIKTLQLHA